eukprot:m.98203 g.98203  ORF g.98203 m.98203 type:complete len:164 (+) comp8855_c0_seq3:1342-1833(+)
MFSCYDCTALSCCSALCSRSRRLAAACPFQAAATGAAGTADGKDGDDQPAGGKASRKELEINPQIVDDSDFYHDLLRDLIERKTSFTGTEDPLEMGRQFVELNKLRTKTKRKVDTKASKGRKIRYDVMPKLANFMAPDESFHTSSDAAKDDLFASLFRQSAKV